MYFAVPTYGSYPYAGNRPYVPKNSKGDVISFTASCIDRPRVSHHLTQPRDQPVKCSVFPSLAS